MKKIVPIMLIFLLLLPLLSIADEKADPSSTTVKHVEKEVKLVGWGDFVDMGLYVNTNGGKGFSLEMISMGIGLGKNMGIGTSYGRMSIGVSETGIIEGRSSYLPIEFFWLLRKNIVAEIGLDLFGTSVSITQNEVYDPAIYAKLYMGEIPLTIWNIGLNLLPAYLEISFSPIQGIKIEAGTSANIYIFFTPAAKPK